MNPKLIKKQFEKSFETYDKNAVVQRVLAEKLSSQIAKIRVEYENILELGCGTGLLTKVLAKNLKFKNYFANDLVEKSEKYIKLIVPEAKFFLGNAQKIKTSQKFDLIISNAVFQWFENLDKVFEYFKPMLRKDGIFAFTTFAPDNYKEIAYLTGLSLDYKSLGEVKTVCSKYFDILYTEEYKQTLKFSTPLELLAHMKNTGVNSLTSKHWTIKEVKDFCDRCSDCYATPKLTYSAIIFVGRVD
ncbi:malonyl-ACP O-methyltransferase BioC [bacterium]|nr:malonyl-ACP O-methyltransferase BioC [bacterium]